MTQANGIFAPRLWAACRRIAKVRALAVVLTAISIAAYCGVIRYMGNIHAVEEGQLYRSAQLDKAQFGHVIKEDGIKSILNLRGRPWPILV